MQSYRFVEEAGALKEPVVNPQEIAEAFEVSVERAVEYLERLARKGKVVRAGETSER